MIFYQSSCHYVIILILSENEKLIILEPSIDKKIEELNKLNKPFDKNAIQLPEKIFGSTIAIPFHTVKIKPIINEKFYLQIFMIKKAGSLNNNYKDGNFTAYTIKLF